MARIELDAATPNQREKRELIIAAAREVLAREGLAACTARAVADASPLTKSSVHYYFRDVDEIVDQAMSAHLDAVLGTLRHAADAEPNPTERPWRVIDTYLTTFRDKPHAALLWFEYWIDLSRRGATGSIADDLSRIRSFLRAVLLDAQHPDADAAADATLSWLLGAVVQQNVAPRPDHTRRSELQRLLAPSADRPLA